MFSKPSVAERIIDYPEKYMCTWLEHSWNESSDSLCHWQAAKLHLCHVLRVLRTAQQPVQQPCRGSADVLSIFCQTCEKRSVRWILKCGAHLTNLELASLCSGDKSPSSCPFVASCCCIVSDKDTPLHYVPLLPDEGEAARRKRSKKKENKYQKQNRKMESNDESDQL